MTSFEKKKKSVSFCVFHTLEILPKNNKMSFRAEIPSFWINSQRSSDSEKKEKRKSQPQEEGKENKQNVEQELEVLETHVRLPIEVLKLCIDEEDDLPPLFYSNSSGRVVDH